MSRIESLNDCFLPPEGKGISQQEAGFDFERQRLERSGLLISRKKVGDWFLYTREEDWSTEKQLVYPLAELTVAAETSRWVRPVGLAANCLFSFSWRAEPGILENFLRYSMVEKKIRQGIQFNGPHFGEIGQFGVRRELSPEGELVYGYVNFDYGNKEVSRLLERGLGIKPNEVREKRCSSLVFWQGRVLAVGGPSGKQVFREIEPGQLKEIGLAVSLSNTEGETVFSLTDGEKGLRLGFGKQLENYPEGMFEPEAKWITKFLFSPKLIIFSRRN